jgi:hypothetical protein
MDRQSGAHGGYEGSLQRDRSIVNDYSLYARHNISWVATSANAG